MTRVLIVEDDPAFRAELVHAVAQAPDLQLVGEAADLAAGLLLLAERPELLLIDLGLPDGSGIELIREAAQRLPALEIMVVTIFGDEVSVMESIAAGATGYLLKGLPAAEIVAHLRQLRAGGSPISPVIARQLLNRLSREDIPTPQSTTDDVVVLSEQETRVLGFAATGLSYEEIAGLMNISRHSVQTYVKRAYRKLRVHTKVEALSEARRRRLLRG